MFFSTCFFVLTLVYVTAPRLPGLYTLGSLATSSASKLTKGLAPGAPTFTRGDGLAASAEEEEKRKVMETERGRFGAWAGLDKTGGGGEVVRKLGGVGGRGKWTEEVKKQARKQEPNLSLSLSLSLSLHNSSRVLRT